MKAGVLVVDFLISIHSLRMEGDWLYFLTSSNNRIFQSTPSAWRETDFFTCAINAICHFNPLPPHGGRLEDMRNGFSGLTISIHSLRMEGDGSFGGKFTSILIFQSTPSAWRETGA